MKKIDLLLFHAYPHGRQVNIYPKLTIILYANVIYSSFDFLKISRICETTRSAASFVLK